MNLGFPEMLFIMVVALLIFGPKKLPEIGRQVGKAMNEFKRASEDFKAQLDAEVRQLELNEARQQVASSSSEPEVSIAPPEGTVPTGQEHGHVLEGEAQVAPAEYGESATSGIPERAHAAAADAVHSPQPPALLTASSSDLTQAEVTTATSADHRNG